MALRDKLGKISKEVALERQVSEEVKQNENLKPIRDSIKKLEKEKLDLEIIKNSLDFKKQTSEDGVGMKEHLDLTLAQKKKAHEQLEEISTENADALEKLGVKSVDELALNPEFSEEEEVVAYKKALSQEEDVRLSDTKLKDRLVKLGLEIGGDDFSYEAASREIGLRLENLEKELITEKIKTPEGKAEITDKLAEEFSKDTEDLFFNSRAIIDKEAQRRSGQKDIRNTYYDFRIAKEEGYSGENLFIEFIDGNKSKVKNCNILNILPENFEKQLNKYGSEVSEAALKQAYAKKVDDAFLNSKSPLGSALKTHSFLESVGPERRQMAIDKLKAFENKKSEFLNILQLKSEELESKGVKFDPVHITGYGGSYEEGFKFGPYVDVQEVLDDMKKQEEILPKYYNPSKLITATEKRITEIDQVIAVVKDITDEKGVNDFLLNDKAATYVGNFTKQTRENRLEEVRLSGIEDKLDWRGLNTENFLEADRLLKSIIAIEEEMKSRVSEKMNELVEYKIMTSKPVVKDKLAHLSNQAPSNINNYEDLSEYVRKMEKEKESALFAMSEIASVKAKLDPEEMVEIKDFSIIVPQKKKEYKLIYEEIKKKEKEIKDKEFELEKEKNSKPWLGKEKWQNRIKKLEEEINKNKNEEIKLKEEYDKKSLEVNLYFKDDKIDFDSQAKKIIKDYKSLSKAGEVFAELEKKLMEVIDKEIPTEIQNYLGRIAYLTKRLNGDI